MKTIELNRKLFEQELCPYCGHYEFTDVAEYDYRMIFKEYTCTSCNRNWTEIFELTRVADPDTDDADSFDVLTHLYGREVA